MGKSDRIAAPASAETLRGLAEAMPVLIAVLAYGTVLGAQASQRGLSSWQVSLMTGSNYAGGSEFAAIALWASPPPIMLIAVMTLLINSRHLVMGAALTPYLSHLPRWKALLFLFLMSDESWALSYADTQRRAGEGRRVPFSLPYYLACGIAIYLGWLGSTTFGAVVGPLMGDVEAYGFDMAFPAVFLVILAGMWRGVKPALPWLISLALAGIVFRLAPGAWHVIAGTLAGVGTALLRSRSE